MTRCWAKLKTGLIREDDLTPVLYGPILMIFCKPQQRLMKGFFLALHDLSPAPRSLFRAVLAVHFTPAAICHSFCRSLDVILRLLSDIWMSWRSSRSVETHFRPLPVCSFVVPNVCCLTLFLWTAILEILRMEATWHSLYPSASKARIEPFFSSLKTFLFNSFGTVNSYFLIPITFEVLLALFLPSSWSYCKRIVMTAVVFILFLVK